MKDDILIGDTPKARKRRKRVKGVQTKGRLWKHSTLADIDGLVDLALIRGAFTFTMVRNPWDRMVSYYHWLRHQAFDHPAVKLAQTCDFSGFINQPQMASSIRAQAYASYMIASDGVEYCRCYIRLEHLQEDAGPLWQHLGFRLDLSVENKSERAVDYRPYYSDRDAALVGEYCAEDIARFGYAFEPGD